MDRKTIGRTTMKKAILGSALALLFAVLFVQADVSYAVDTEPPVLKGLVMQGADSVQADGDMTMEIDVEDASGVIYLELYFENSDGDVAYMYPLAGGGTLYSGKHTIQGGAGFSRNGTYMLMAVTLEDANGNEIEYSNYGDYTALDDLGIQREVNIVGAAEAQPLPMLKSFVVRNPEAVDAKGYITVDLEMENSSFNSVTVGFNHTSGYYSRLDYNAHGEKTGKQTIKIPAYDNLPAGENRITWISVWGSGGTEYYHYSETKDCFYTEYADPRQYLPADAVTKTINVVNSTADTVAPVVNSVDIKTHNLLLPTALQVEVDITEDHIGDRSGVRDFSLVFRNENGHEIYTPNYLPNDIFGKYTGTWTLNIPFSPFMGEGNYTLEEIHIDDGNINQTRYQGAELDAICSDRTLTMNSPYNIAYEGPLGNTEEVLDAVNTLEEGETAVLDARLTTIVPKAVFESIAGKDVTLVISMDDVEWVFDGKKVVRSRCKDIDVATGISPEDGQEYGYADDKQVLVIYFADNGKLPGQAKVRINNAYISAKYHMGIDHLMLTYDNGGQMIVEDMNVAIEGDEAAVLVIDHNSKFILSGGLLSISKAKVSVSNCIYSGKWLKPSVTVKLRGKKLDSKYYKKKYSNNKKVGTATVVVNGNPDFGYKGKATGHFYINPKKASISKVTAGKRKITVKMKSKPSALGATTYKIEYRVAGTSKWKSTTTKSYTKTIKNLKKGKRYQVRVRAYKGSRKGAVSAIKKSGAVK